MQTQVLGTIFDVKAYRKDAPKVTLMEGKVKVSNADTEVEMRPGQTATLQADKIVVSKASSSASDWLEGDFDMGSGYAGRGDERHRSLVQQDRSLPVPGEYG